MLVSRDHGLYLVAAGCEKTAVFAGTGGTMRIFRVEVGEIPDPIIKALRREVNEAHFFGRIELRQCSHPRAHEKAQVFVFFAMEIRVEELGMIGIVNRSQDVGIDVIHGLALE